MRKAFFAVLTSVGLLLGLGVTVAPAASAATSTDVWFLRVNIAGQTNTPVNLASDECPCILAFRPGLTGNDGFNAPGQLQLPLGTNVYG
jgi:hypothetical protein